MIKAEECIQYKAENDARKEETVKKILKILDGFLLEDAKEILSVAEGSLSRIAKIDADMY